MPRLAQLLSRFRRERSGAAAVEFAFVALPFFVLIFAIIQTALALFATQVLQTQTSAASREIMTGVAKETVRHQFRERICHNNFLFSCEKLGIEVRAAANFNGADSSSIKPQCAAPVDPKKPNPTVEAACYTPGTGGSVMIVRVTYRWPFAIDLTADDRAMTLAATVAFLNEPFP